MDNKGKELAKNILTKADVEIGGNRPWDIQVHDDRFFNRVLKGGSLALGESYMDGWWDVEKLDQFFDKVLSARLEKHLSFSLNNAIAFLEAWLFNPQTKNKAFEIGEQHYDIGNDLYEKMLDKRLVYTCGYWKNADNLDQAQEDKLDLVCRKIGLKSKQKVLDIGCGWGSFAKFAAEKYGGHVTGVTVSKEQIELGKRLCTGLPVDLHYQDYRDVKDKFDHIISLGMFEHVGVKNYRTYMEKAAECLNDDGLFLLHTIGTNISGQSGDPWVTKYIFTNSKLPSAAQIAKASEGLFVMEDWHNFGADYDKTLMSWFTNFDNAWPELKNKYDDRFYRMWKYYLLSCAGSFRARRIQLWQVVFSKHGVRGGYNPVR